MLIIQISENLIACWKIKSSKNKGNSHHINLHITCNTAKLESCDLDGLKLENLSQVGIYERNLSGTFTDFDCIRYMMFRLHPSCGVQFLSNFMVLSLTHLISFSCIFESQLCNSSTVCFILVLALPLPLPLRLWLHLRLNESLHVQVT